MVPHKILVKYYDLTPEEGMPPLAVLDLDIPAGTRIWLVLHFGDIDDLSLRTFGCDCAERAQPTDSRSLEAIRASRLFGQKLISRSELEAAKCAAFAEDLVHIVNNRGLDAEFPARAAAYTAQELGVTVASGAAAAALGAAEFRGERKQEEEIQIKSLRSLLSKP